jgi:signal transduction histidine kinase/DNA-binding response OmpR family regulator
MNFSLLSLKLKIITGYVMLVLILLLLLGLIYKENSRMFHLDQRSAIALEYRKQVEAITVQILDIALQSEQIIAWNEKDITAYREKLYKTETLLHDLQNHITDNKQRDRISSILTLLSDKENQTFAILKDFKELRKSNELLDRRIPNIIQEAKQDKQCLADQINDNNGQSEKKSGGFLGLFRHKIKTDSQTKKENETILQQSQARSGILLRSLSNEIRLANKSKREKMLIHMDSLSRKNVYLNGEISRLITEFSSTEEQQMKEKSEAYLLGQKKILQHVSLLGIGTILLAIFFYFILHLDLKKRYRYRMQLEKLNRNNEDLLHARKNMMLAVSHDLRAPLTSIHLCTELLINESSKEKRNQLCETVLQSSDSMTALLNALLYYHRLDTGKEQPNPVPFKMKSFAEILEAEFRPLARKAGLAFNVRYNDEDIVVSGDRERLHQIVSNLLSNAIKFTSEGEVSLNFFYQEGKLTIEVLDTGVGLTRKQIERIFQPFERLGNAESSEGFGLGLAITQGLVGLLNGAIDVHSEPGKGSAFVVQIPLIIIEEQNLISDAVSTCNLPAGLRILAIDDDPVLLLMTKDMLSSYRIQCDTCKSIAELTTHMRKQTYDLLITDIRMPKINGFELLELLRTSDIGISRIIPVLALTACAECQEENFITAGFAGCLYKPFSITELLSAVQRCIGTQQEISILQADFSELLSEEHNGKEMLELLIRETDKNMETLAESMEKEDWESVSLLVHHLLPLWEIVRIETQLRELCKILAVRPNIEESKIRDIVEQVIMTGKQLSMQAVAKIKEEVYE